MQVRSFQIWFRGLSSVGQLPEAVREAVADTVEDLSARPDAEAAWAGMGFMEDDENEDDWMQWVRNYVEDDDGAGREDDEDLL